MSDSVILRYRIAPLPFLLQLLSLFIVASKLLPGSQRNTTYGNKEKNQLIARNNPL